MENSYEKVKYVLLGATPLNYIIQKTFCTTENDVGHEHYYYFEVCVDGKIYHTADICQALDYFKGSDRITMYEQYVHLHPDLLNQTHVKVEHIRFANYSIQNINNL